MTIWAAIDTDAAASLNDGGAKWRAEHELEMTVPPLLTRRATASESAKRGGSGPA